MAFFMIAFFTMAFFMMAFFYDGVFYDGVFYDGVFWVQSLYSAEINLIKYILYNVLYIHFTVPSTGYLKWKCVGV